MTKAFSLLPLLGLCVLLSCKGEANKPNKTGKPDEKGEVVYAIKSNPPTLDPIQNNDSTGEVLAKMYESLVTFSDDLKIVPALATKWEISPDGTTYTFTLKQGVVFHQGQKFGPEDVIYSLGRLKDPKNASPFFDWYKIIQSITPKGVDRIEIKLARPFSPFLGLLAMTSASILDEEWTSLTGAGLPDQANGTGPFSLGQWRKDQDIKLTKFDKYHGEPAKVASILYRILKDETAAESEFLQGRVDILGPNFVSDGAVGRLVDKKSEAIEQHKGPGLNTFYLGIQNTIPPFHLKPVRQALNMAINRDLINQKLFKGKNVLAYGPVPPELLPKHSPKAPYKTDIAKAQKLLKQAGVQKGFKVELWHRAAPTDALLAQIISEDLKKVGFDISLMPLEKTAYKEKVIKGEATLFLANWIADYPDPENFLFPLFHSVNVGLGGNRARYKNLDMDSLITQAQGTADDKVRGDLYLKANDLLHEEAPWVYLWHQPAIGFSGPKVGGYKAHALYHSDKGNQVQKFK